MAASGVVLLAGGGVAAAKSPSDRDGGFGNKGVARLGKGTEIFGAATQRDGKIVVVGDQRNKLLVTRLTKSGRVDRSFNRGHFVVARPYSIGRSVAIQRDGKIVVAGYLTDKAGVNHAGMYVERLTSAGRLDRSFSRDGVQTLLPKAAFGSAFGVAVSSDGKIVLAGGAMGKDGAEHVAVARLTKSGSTDRGFGAGGVRIAEGTQELGRFGSAQGVALQSRGRVIVAGSVRPNLQNPQGFVARFSSKGNVDKRFRKGAYVVPANVTGGGASGFSAVAVDRTGKIVAAGQSTATSRGSLGTPAFTVISKLSAGGAPLGSFSRDGRVTLPSALGAFAPQPIPGARAVGFARGGTVLAAGDFSTGIRDTALWALNSGGGSKSFGTKGLVRTQIAKFTSSPANALAVAPDGGIIVAGTSDDFKTRQGFVLRYRGFGR